MRDPDLVVRAQRAAAELERAWDRFRTAHGLGAEPLAPVSSYVGYSLEEPWGEPRVVFGVAAEEAEQLAALLNSHDRGGRSAAAQSRPGQSAAVQAGPGQPAGVQIGPGQSAAAQSRPGQSAAVQAGPGQPAAANGRLASLTAAAEIARAAVGARLQVPAQGPTARRGNAASFADAPERPVTAQATATPSTATPSTATPPSAAATPPSATATPALRPAAAPRPTPSATASPSPAAASASLPLAAATAASIAPPVAVAPPPPPAVVTPADPAETGPARQLSAPHIAGAEWQPDWAGTQADGGETALTAFRPATASLPGDGPDPDPFPDEQHAVGGQPAERPRGHRHAGGHATQRPARPKRGSAAADHDPLPPAKRAAARRGDNQGYDGDADSGDSGLAAMADDLAGWASGELPGQARPTASWTPAYTDPDNADPAGGGARRDKVI